MTLKNEVKTGKIIIAEPFMLDPHFRRSVVLITEHREDGDVGFILNKMLDVRLNDVMSGFTDFNAPLFYGGPVATNSIQFIHNVGNLLESSMRISNGVYWGGNWDNLRFLVESKLIEPKNIRFFVGYSGWDEGQLMSEMSESAWIVGDMHANYLFNAQPHTLWRTVLQHKGDAFSIIADMPDDNNLN
ncbi:MAG: YqgE/AlgH family protein [Saprospiraceae bacterium]|nr:YqgE/AlgH family protein [Saprospiraceae bacterium]